MDNKRAGHNNEIIVNRNRIIELAAKYYEELYKDDELDITIYNHSETTVILEGSENEITAVFK